MLCRENIYVEWFACVSLELNFSSTFSVRLFILYLCLYWQTLPLTRFRSDKPPIREPRPHSVGALIDLSLYEEQDVTSGDEQRRELSRSQPIPVVPIDITGSSFERLSAYRSSIRSASVDSVECEVSTTRRAAARKTASSTTTTTVASTRGLDDIADHVFRVTSPSSNLRSRSASRERWRRFVLGKQEPYTTDTDGEKAQHKSRKSSASSSDNHGTAMTRSCSLRKSLRSLFQQPLLKSKSSEMWIAPHGKQADMWSSGTPVVPGPPVVDLTQTTKNRSLSGSSRYSLGSSLSGRLRERHIGLAIGGKSLNSKGYEEETSPQVLQRAVPTTTSTMPTSNQQLASNFTRTVPCPNHPWAKPFSDVTLRSRQAQAANYKRYSSSGKMMDKIICGLFLLE